MYSIKKINKHALLITITKSKEVRFLQMFHRRFGFATRVLLFKSNRVQVGEHGKGTKYHPHTLLYQTLQCRVGVTIYPL